MSRIPVLLRLNIVALLLTVARPGPVAYAQDATPDDATVVLPPPLQDMVEAINAVDSAAIAALYAEDGTHEDVPAGVVARGREEIAAFVDETLSQFRDVRFEPLFGHVAGDLAVLEYSLSVTDLQSGLPVVYRGVLVFELDGTLIRRSTDSYDLASILGQLGQLEASAASAGATPVP